MKRNITFLVLFGTLIFFSSSSFAQDQSQEEADAQKAWMEFMTPGEYHQMMAKNVGNWKTVTKFWMDPNAEPQIIEGTAKTESLLGGRYFKTTHTGEMMGMPFEGFSIDGYDNAKKEFFSIWVDNMGTSYMLSKGNYDEDSKTLSMTGTTYDPMYEKDMEYKEVIKIIDDNNQIMEMYTNQDGNEVKVMSVEMVKQE